MKLEVDPIKFWSRVGDPDENGCMNWLMSCRSNGYGQVMINGKNVSTHRLAYFLSNGSISDKLMVMHSCDNRKCCNPEHLSQGTCRDNIVDMMKKGRGKGQAVAGNPSKNRRITPEQRIEIINLLASGKKGVDIAKFYKVTSSLVSKIKHGVV